MKQSFFSIYDADPNSASHSTAFLVRKTQKRAQKKKELKEKEEMRVESYIIVDRCNTTKVFLAFEGRTNRSVTEPA